MLGLCWFRWAAGGMLAGHRLHAGLGCLSARQALGSGWGLRTGEAGSAAHRQGVLLTARARGVCRGPDLGVSLAGVRARGVSPLALSVAALLAPAARLSLLPSPVPTATRAQAACSLPARPRSAPGLHGPLLQL